MLITKALYPHAPSPPKIKHQLWRMILLVGDGDDVPVANE
jgi:hypothetical protein